MYSLYKFAKGETTMARIKLTPEDLRTSAQRYTEGSDNVTQVLTTLTNEQANIADNWDGSAFDSFEAQFSSVWVVALILPVLAVVSGSVNATFSWH